jgi:hypothetical protein
MYKYFLFTFLTILKDFYLHLMRFLSILFRLSFCLLQGFLSTEYNDFFLLLTRFSFYDLLGFLSAPYKLSYNALKDSFEVLLLLLILTPSFLRHS